ncbi:hypothetical protein [Kitasatospora sp. NPDC101183]|uniref:hypothetical protein n=1 Tax=Kitasatospora sp. NPDC101183 TaxID=3364100 RepID=UPI0038102C52
MPGRTRRLTLTAASTVLALCTAAVVTGCGAADTGSPAAAPTPVASSAVATPGSPPTSAVPAPSAPTGDPAPAAGNAAPTTAPTTAPTGAPVPAPANANAAPGTALTPAVQPAGLARLPMAPALAWKPDGPLSSQNVKGRTITLNECAGVTGATTWQQQAYLSQARNPASQQLFSFSGPEAANAAYRKLLADMDACQGASLRLQGEQGKPQDATVTRTASTSDGTSWSRTWTGIGGLSAPDHQTNHVYALQQGAVLTLFQFDELDDRPGPAAHDNGTDPSVLAALAALGSAQH